MKGYFITGTDTGVGKTTVACELLKQWRNSGKKTAALKPIASGCYKYNSAHKKIGEVTEEKNGGQLRSQDADRLINEATLKFPYEWVNPFAFLPPIAPHIAAEAVGIQLTVDLIYEKCLAILQSEADYIVVEGAGGFKVPLNEEETMATLAVRFGFPVILVVALRLGCLNHAILTVEAMLASGVPIAGFVINDMNRNDMNGSDMDRSERDQNGLSTKKMLCSNENKKALRRLLQIPYLGECFNAFDLNLNAIPE